MSNVFDPFGFKPSEVSFISLGLLLSGVVGAIVAGAILDRTKLYKVSMHVITFMIASLTALLILVLTYIEQKAVLIGVLMVGGFFSTGYVPLCFSYGSELTFPLQPALVNGMLAMAGSVASFLLSLLGAFLNKEREGDDLLEPDELLAARRFRSKSVLAMMTISALVAFVMSFAIKENLRRLRYTNRPEAIEDQEKQDSPKAVDHNDI